MGCLRARSERGRRRRFGGREGELRGRKEGKERKVNNTSSFSPFFSSSSPSAYASRVPHLFDA